MGIRHLHPKMNLDTLVVQHIEAMQRFFLQHEPDAKQTIYAIPLCLF